MHALDILSTNDWGDLYRTPEKPLKPLADKMYRACAQKDQALTKIRTLNFLLIDVSQQDSKGPDPVCGRSQCGLWRGGEIDSVVHVNLI